MKESKKRCLDLIQEYKDQCVELYLARNLDVNEYLDMASECEYTLGCLNNWLADYLGSEWRYAFGNDLDLELIDQNFDRSCRAILGIIILEWRILERKRHWR